MRNPRSIFWIEAVLATSAALLGALTLGQPAWIERILPVDPDHSSGMLEWRLVVVLFLAAAWLSTLAVRNWRKAPHAG